MSKKVKSNKFDIVSTPPVIWERKTTDYLNKEVKQQALYVVKTRAIPNIMDGLRVGARKIIHSAITGKLKSGKKEKFDVLIGNTMENEFHHGTVSLKNTIEQLGSKHLFEFAPFDVIGQTGTLSVPVVDTAARYFSIRLNDNITLFKPDLDLLTYKIEDDKYVEPHFFLPIVPIVLLWRTNSPGFGFSFRSFSHNMNDVIDATISSIVNGSCNQLHFVPIKPHIVGIKPENIIYNDSKKSWYNVAEYRIDDINSDIVVVDDMPFNMSYRKYAEHLAKLKEENYIFNFTERKIGKRKFVVIKFAKGRLATAYAEKWKFYTKLKLFVKIPKLTLNTIDVDGKSIVHYETPQDLVDGFVRRRLIYYRQRKTKLVETIKKQIIDLTDKAKFIQLILDEKLIINKRSIADIKKDCDKLGVTHEGLKLAISKLTSDEVDKALREIEELKLHLDYIVNTSPEMMYVLDLVDLKRKVSEIQNGYIPKVKKVAGVEYI